MTRVTGALLNGAIAVLVATAVAYAVGRNRDTAVVAGSLSVMLTVLSSWFAAETNTGPTVG